MATGKTTRFHFFVQQGALHQISTVLVCFHVKGVWLSCPHVEKELVFTILLRFLLKTTFFAKIRGWKTHQQKNTHIGFFCFLPLFFFGKLTYIKQIRNWDPFFFSSQIPNWSVVFSLCSVKVKAATP